MGARCWLNQQLLMIIITKSYYYYFSVPALSLRPLARELELLQPLAAVGANLRHTAEGQY